VYRHLPLTSIHPNAQLAAQASEAAHLQDKFWDYHGLLFEKQTEWSEESDPSDLFIGYASELGLDAEKFESDMNSKEIEDYVNSESLEASRIGLSSTPSFFVNGERVNLSDIDIKLETLTTSGE